MSDIEILEPDWPAPPRVRAAFTLRTGGVSLPPFGTLNLGAHVCDSPDAVAENRRRVRQRLGLPAEPGWLQQVHGIEVADLDADDRGEADAHAPSVAAPDATGALRAAPPIVADAAVSRRPGKVCVIQVADCIPVLFAALEGSAVGAAHAGWRGLVAGVLEATVRALRVDPAALCAWLGPAIGKHHFEVGEEVRAAFLEQDEGAATAFEANPRGRWQCDLHALARRRLAGLGVRHVSGGDLCTYSDAQRFYSYRRDGRCGRMGAFVWTE